MSASANGLLSADANNNLWTSIYHPQKLMESQTYHSEGRSPYVTRMTSLSQWVRKHSLYFKHWCKIIMQRFQIMVMKSRMILLEIATYSFLSYCCHINRACQQNSHNAILNRSFQKYSVKILQMQPLIVMSGKSKIMHCVILLPPFLMISAHFLVLSLFNYYKFFILGMLWKMSHGIICLSNKIYI